jgi:hypothetical protein
VCRGPRLVVLQSGAEVHGRGRQETGGVPFYGQPMVSMGGGFQTGRTLQQPWGQQGLVHPAAPEVSLFCLF